MFRGIYSSASAMDTVTRQHEIISNNLAHLNVPGFRRSFLAAQATSHSPAGLAAATNLNGNHASRSYVDFSQGPIVSTDRPLDVAIAGDGFFRIQGPRGDLYTRNGSFHLTPDGNLVTSDGLPVLGAGGPILIPPQVPHQEIQIGTDGTIHAAGNRVGKLDIVTFADLHSLIQFAPTRFMAGVDSVPEESLAAIRQGALESANTIAVTEMIQMIVGLRQMEAAQRTLRSISEALGQLTNMDS